MLPNILFLCTGNSCRSQMAEAIAREHLGNAYNFFSAGTEEHGLNEYMLKVVQELSLDTSGLYSKTLDKVDEPLSLVISVCDSAKDQCPTVPGMRHVHRAFEDPPKLASAITEESAKLEIYRRVRDEIKLFITNDLPQILAECIPNKKSSPGGA